jgi:hypothetical protein
MAMPGGFLSIRDALSSLLKIPLVVQDQEKKIPLVDHLFGEARIAGEKDTIDSDVIYVY